MPSYQAFMVDLFGVSAFALAALLSVIFVRDPGLAEVLAIMALAFASMAFAGSMAHTITVSAGFASSLAVIVMILALMVATALGMSAVLVKVLA